MIDRTLEELENKSWGGPDSDSHLVVECHRLRKVPISNFSIEDLRILLGQNIGSKYLLPLAIKVLQENPLAEGDYYEGDLLRNVVRLPKDFFNSNPHFLSEVKSIIRSLDRIPEEIEEAVVEFNEKYA